MRWRWRREVESMGEVKMKAKVKKKNQAKSKATPKGQEGRRTVRQESPNFFYKFFSVFVRYFFGYSVVLWFSHFVFLSFIF